MKANAKKMEAHMKELSNSLSLKGAKFFAVVNCTMTMKRVLGQHKAKADEGAFGWALGDTECGCI